MASMDAAAARLLALADERAIPVGRASRLLGMDLDAVDRAGAALQAARLLDVLEEADGTLFLQSTWRGKVFLHPRTMVAGASASVAAGLLSAAAAALLSSAGPGPTPWLAYTLLAAAWGATTTGFVALRRVRNRRR